jgi:hypothetical protein
MPLKSGKSQIPSNIREMHHSKSYAKVVRRHGKKVADKMAVAAAINASKKRK